MEEKKTSNHSVEEYKTLRAEILRNLDAAERNMLACITASIVALVYGTKEGSQSALAFACIAPIYFWLQHVVYKREIAKISAYISVFLEDPKNGLMWETRAHRTDLVNEGRPDPISAASAILLPYPILLIVSFLAIFFTKPIELDAPWELGIIILSVAVLLIARRSLPNYATLRIDWLARYRAIEEEEKEMTSSQERPVPATPLPSRPTRGPKQTPGGAA